MSNKIGENIVKYRKMNGISQKYLANKIGISVQGLLKIEKGIVSPKASTLEKIIGIFCITPNQLFGVDKITETNVDFALKLRKLLVKKVKKGKE